MKDFLYMLFKYFCSKFKLIFNALFEACANYARCICRADIVLFQAKQEQRLGYPGVIACFGYFIGLGRQKKNTGKNRAIKHIGQRLFTYMVAPKGAVVFVGGQTALLVAGKLRHCFGSFTDSVFG